MRVLNRFLKRTPMLGNVWLHFLRAKTAIGYYRRPFSDLVKWLFRSKETTNFTYELEENNKRYLASLIADVANIQFSVVWDYITEIEQDRELQKHLTDATQKSDFTFVESQKLPLGRRVGWYALTRAFKPKTVFETGVDKGLGSCVLTAALKRNREEGNEGRYYGTDINPKAGCLLCGDYANYGLILYGDSIESLKKFDGIIDLFINDSDHSADYEAEEYKTIANKLSEDAIILGDNAHCTDKLLEFSLETNRHFVFFQEKPLDHWYPGAGIGMSFKR